MKLLRILFLSILLAGAVLWTQAELQRFAAQPISSAYTTAADLINSLPQIYIWAAIIATFVFIGLRRIPFAAGAPGEQLEAEQRHHSSLGRWLKLIRDRRRGAYFYWRLANRLAALERWIGGQHAPGDEQVAAYLRLGAESRTIGVESNLASMNVELESVVTYLEADAAET